MLLLLTAIVLMAMGALVPLLARRFTLNMPRPLIRLGGAAALLAGVFCAIQTSIVMAPADKVGVVRKIYGFHSLPQGHLIATHGETGYQADVIPPGAFRVSLFYNVVNAVTYVPVVSVPQGFYGRVVSRDGEPLAEGEVMAAAWPEKDIARFLDPEHFLTNGGRRGLQATVLLPGAYPINLALYNVRIGYEANGRDVTASTDDVYDIEGLHHENTPLTTAITRIPAGFVAVVRSAITERGAECKETISATRNDGLVARLVPKGCRGIWSEVLNPGDYYLNRDAYSVTQVDTRVQTLEFRGGYTRRYIDLKVDQKGDFTQSERSEAKPFDNKAAADQAVFAKVEGWEVPQELRAVIQVEPANAPIVVAAVGGLPEIERSIIIPAIRSHVRNVLGGNVSVTEAAPDATGKPEPPRQVIRPTRILDLIEQRPALEAAIQVPVAADGARAGVDVKEIRLGDSVIPPELLLARQREQLAGQLKRAYEQEQVAQTQRQTAEQARATADRQAELVGEQIAVKKAELGEQRRAAEGRAEKAYMEALAAGQAAQTVVLGQDGVIRLQQLKLVLGALAEHPDILGSLRLPATMVIGGSGLEGAAAVLGATLSGAAPMAGSGNRN